MPARIARDGIGQPCHANFERAREQERKSTTRKPLIGLFLLGVTANRPPIWEVSDEADGATI